MAGVRVLIEIGQTESMKFHGIPKPVPGITGVNQQKMSMKGTILPNQNLCHGQHYTEAKKIHNRAMLESECSVYAQTTINQLDIFF